VFSGWRIILTVGSDAGTVRFDIVSSLLPGTFTACPSYSSSYFLLPALLRISRISGVRVGWSFFKNARMLECRIIRRVPILRDTNSLFLQSLRTVGRDSPPKRMRVSETECRSGITAGGSCRTASSKRITFLSPTTNFCYGRVCFVLLHARLSDLPGRMLRPTTFLAVTYCAACP
jgi:hypothetical protein